MATVYVEHMPPLSFSGVNEAGEDYIGIPQRKIASMVDHVTPQPRWTVLR